jgi:hypothetical protein
MANLKHSTGLKNFIDDTGMQTAFDSDGRLAIYSGSQPANADADVGAGTLLATLSFGSDAFAASSGGSVSANAITSDTDAAAGGNAAWFRIYKAADGATGSSSTKRRIDGSVTATGGGGDLTLDNIAVTQHGTVAITSLSWGLAA